MKKEYSIYLLGSILMLLASPVVAQSTAGCYASVVIVNPVGLTSASLYDFTDAPLESGNNKIESSKNKHEIRVADLNIAALAQDVYCITIPQEVALRNKNGSSCITAVITLHTPVTGQLLIDGQQRFNVNSELVFDGNAAKGKFSASPFEVTVNFN